REVVAYEAELVDGLEGGERGGEGVCQLRRVERAEVSELAAVDDDGIAARQLDRRAAFEHAADRLAAGRPDQQRHAPALRVGGDLVLAVAAELALHEREAGRAVHAAPLGADQRNAGLERE